MQIKKKYMHLFILIILYYIIFIIYFTLLSILRIERKSSESHLRTRPRKPPRILRPSNPNFKQPITKSPRRAIHAGLTRDIYTRVLAIMPDEYFKTSRMQDRERERGRESLGEKVCVDT